MIQELYQECAERVVRIVLNQVINNVELKVQYADLVNMVKAQIEHDLAAIQPKQHIFHQEVTKYVMSISEEDLTENGGNINITKKIHEIKDLVNQLNKDYLPGLKLDTND